MNAGAEYVLYRILRALQDNEGIHPESLLVCLGALAGYACRHVSGPAPHRPLAGTPMSIWALVRRAVQKLGKPAPDFHDVVTHVKRTVGTRAFGQVRVPQQRRPRRAAIVYLRQLWPQVLPIAQRFCRRPAQLPVLFGIALQRAIDITQNLVNPTLGARMAMECAVAMSMVSLPGEVAAAEIPETERAPLMTEPRETRHDDAVAASLSPIASALRGIRAERLDVGGSAKHRGAAARSVSSTPDGWAWISRRPAATLVAVGFLAAVTVAGANWRAVRDDVATPATPERKLQVANVQAAPMPFSAAPEQNAPETAAAFDDAVVADLPTAASAPEQVDPDLPPPNSAEAAEMRRNEEAQRQLDANATGDSEMLPVVDATPSAPPAPSAIPVESLF
ncbi:MAG TPA: hypothetical protein VG994_08150 [Steroidobacteraceae bacterium]|nr:hypothetical protein [Steroidobacteraceae bacterium]